MWEQRSLGNRKTEMEMFLYFWWWIKGKTSALFCLGYGVMHATLEDNFMKDL
jgi:hypothetical protein